MKITLPEVKAQHGDFFKGMKEGIGYAWGFPPIKYIILLLALSALVAMPYPVLMPVFVKEVLQGGPNTLGFLMSAAGVGALAGAIYLASRQNVLGLEKIIVISTCSFAAGLVLLSFANTLWVAMACMALTGFGMVVQLAASNTVLQTIADDYKRGRVMSFFIMSFMCMVPIGSLLFGGLASIIGIATTLLMGGSVCLVGGLLYAWRFSSVKDMVHVAYLKKGIIHEK
jgi:MFS family permease